MIIRNSQTRKESEWTLDNGHKWAMNTSEHRENMDSSENGIHLYAVFTQQEKFSHLKREHSSSCSSVASPRIGFRSNTHLLSVCLNTNNHRIPISTIFSPALSVLRSVRNNVSFIPFLWLSGIIAPAQSHATVQPCIRPCFRCVHEGMSIGPSVSPSVGNQFFFSIHFTDPYTTYITITTTTASLPTPSIPRKKTFVVLSMFN